MSESLKPGHVVKVTRSVHGSYGWQIEISGEGVTTDDLRASVAVLREIDAEMRAPKEAPESDGEAEPSS